jgi:hypothetical protein
MALGAGSVTAQTAEGLVAGYIKALGGADRIGVIKTLRQSGRSFGGGGSEVPVVQENKRPNMVREEFTTQGLTGITAFDGTAGWKIDPWGGKKDPESLEEEEMKQIIEDSDFDGPLVNYQKKGNRVEFVGREEIEGTDTFKLKITLKNGDVEYYYLEAESFLPIKIDIERKVRGAVKFYEAFPGEYKEVSGWYLPFSIEGNVKGSQERWKIAYERIEANVTLDDSRFVRPVPAGSPH